MKSKSKKLQDFNFVAAGDYGCSEWANKTIARMANKNPEIVLALGDLSYDKKGDCWLKLVSPLDTGEKLKIIFGQHDVDIKRNETNIQFRPSRYYQYFDHFKLDKPFYSFEYQNVHFLVMATAKNRVIPYEQGSEQYNFVKNDLQIAHKNNSIDWIIVLSFKPFYSLPSKHPGERDLRQTYHQLFDMYGVDFVLQAHNHNYQRTYPIAYNDTDHSSPVITNYSSGKYQNLESPVFVTVGTAGADLHNFTGTVPYVLKKFLDYGFLNVDITDNGSKLTATFYETGGMAVKDMISVKKTK